MGNYLSKSDINKFKNGEKVWSLTGWASKNWEGYQTTIACADEIINPYLEKHPDQKGWVCVVVKRRSDPKFAPTRLIVQYNHTKQLYHLSAVAGISFFGAHPDVKVANIIGDTPIIGETSWKRTPVS